MVTAGRRAREGIAATPQDALNPDQVAVAVPAADVVRPPPADPPRFATLPHLTRQRRVPGALHLALIGADLYG
jgi:hypothetical protein